MNHVLPRACTGFRDDTIQGMQNLYTTSVNVVDQDGALVGHGNWNTRVLWDIGVLHELDEDMAMFESYLDLLGAQPEWCHA